MERNMDKEFDDVPHSQSNVSLRLADIQKRCSQLLDEPGESTGLSLEEPTVEPDKNNPYSRG